MKSFDIEVLTPEREFFCGKAESVVFQTLDGEYCVMSGHQPTIMAINVGVLKIQIGDETKYAFCSEGFAEITPEKTVLFSQSCEWPDEIDPSRAEHAKQYAIEKLRHSESVSEHRYSQISLSRAVTRIRVNKIKNK